MKSFSVVIYDTKCNEVASQWFQAYSISEAKSVANIIYRNYGVNRDMRGYGYNVYELNGFNKRQIF